MWPLRKSDLRAKHKLENARKEQRDKIPLAICTVINAISRVSTIAAQRVPARLLLSKIVIICCRLCYHTFHHQQRLTAYYLSVCLATFLRLAVGLLRIHCDRPKQPAEIMLVDMLTHSVDLN
jgi:hypothetical protein